MSAIDPLSVGIGFIIGAFSGAVGMMVADWFREWRNRLKTPVNLRIDPVLPTKTKIQWLIGFGVAVEQVDDQIKGAYPKCNGRRYPWYVNNHTVDTLNLPIGEEPSWFSPFIITFEYMEYISAEKNVEPISRRKKQSKHGIVLTVQERNSNTIIFSRLYSIPADVTSFKYFKYLNKNLFKINITLIAEQGIKRKRNYNGDFNLSRFDIEKIEKGVPLMNTLNPYFEILIEGNWRT